MLRMPKFHFRLTAKLLMLNAAIVIAIAGIATVTLLFSRNIRENLLATLDKDISTLSSNARLGQELGNIFAETQIVINRLIGRQEDLVQKKDHLIQILDKKIAELSGNDGALLDALQLFRQRLQNLFDLSQKIVENSSALQSVQAELNQELTKAENLTQEMLVSFTMDGNREMVLTFEQFNNSLEEYRHLLLQIDVQLNASKYAYFNTESVEEPYEETVKGLIGDLEAQLLYITAVSEELKPSGKKLLEVLSRYREPISQFYVIAPGFQQQLRAVSEVQFQVMNVMEGVTTGIDRTTAVIREKIFEDIQASEKINLALAVVVLCLLVLIAGSILRILRPIVHLANIAEQLSAGDLDGDIAQLPRKNSADELGMLSRAFQKLIMHNREVAAIAAEIAQGNLAVDFTPRSEKDRLGRAFVNMASYLNEIASIAKAIGGGDLRREIEPKTERDVLGHAFQKLKGLQHSIRDIQQGGFQLKSASGDLHRISEKMVGFTHQSSQKAQTVLQHSQQIDRNVNAVATATEEMSASIREISRNSSSIAEIAGMAVERANSANTIIKELDRQSQEIGDIITVITSVTQQTNLLALNATIEAARAGDSGKGFAVVANEIKQLSRETADSTEDIIRKLEGIQAGASDATEAITEVLSINTQISDISTATADGVKQQSGSTNEIAERMGEIANDSQGITELITEVASSAQKTSEGAIGVQYAAQELASLADDLQLLVDKFKV